MKNRRLFPEDLLIAAVVLFVGLAWPGVVNADACVPTAPNVVQVGPTCVDKYEESVWRIPGPVSMVLLMNIGNGKATLEDLMKTGAVQLGVSPPPPENKVCDRANEYGPNFPVNGNWTAPLYAVTLPGVVPSVCISWFQAEQACAISGKRLLTNQEWQRAVAGTPDTAACNIAFFLSPTGSFPGCISKWKVLDMVGNAFEWVADWMPRSSGCGSWSGVAGGLFDLDLSCMNGAANDNLPGALIRGSARNGLGVSGENGVFSVDDEAHPSDVFNTVGFRCGR